MADRLFTTQLDSGTSQDFDGAWHNLGTRFQLSADGTLTGGRAFFPTPKPSTQFIWAVFRISDQAIVAQCDLLATFGSPALSAWNTFTSASFSTPGDVALSSSEEYIVVTATDRDVIFKNTGVSYPISSGGIASGSEARWLDGGTGLQYPTGVRTGDYYGADVEVVAAAPSSGARVQVNYPPPHILQMLIANNARQWQQAIGAQDATVNANVIAAVAALPAAIEQAGETVSPSAIAAIAALPAATEQTGETVSPSAIAAVAALPLATKQTGETVSPSAIVAIVALPLATKQTGETVSPSAIAAVTALPAPSVQAGGSATVSPAAIAVIAALPARTLSTGETVAPLAIAAVAALPAHTLSAGATASPAVVATLAALPGPVVQAGGASVHVRLGGLLVASSLRGVVRVGGVAVTFG